ncbi:MAG: radical SAM protein [Acidobacteria bacterium]|nr:radical SAM protein [Acidobacteriota bacterium]
MPTRTILSPTSGFIRDAGFTHSLTPARNCTFGCSYCYVPTMRLQGGLQPADWQRWGQFTTFKPDAPALLAKQLRPGQIIYCSPLVDPYQPAEAAERLMPQLLAVLAAQPPRRFVLQTRGTLIRRDIELLRRVPGLRVSFSLTTNRDEVRRLFEPHCSTFEQRLETIAALREAGIDVWATLAPLLPCDPELLAEAALNATGRDLVGDPLHVRAVKPRGATTRDAALRIIDHHGFQSYLDPPAQAALVERIARTAAAHGRQFLTGPAGFALLSAAD